MPLVFWNPLEEFHSACAGALGRRDEAVSRFSFAVPTQEAANAIARSSPNGVVELGAGLGYWARVLDHAGIDVAAYDIAPPPAAENRWYAGLEPWYPVRRGSVSSLSQHHGRTLLLVWPTRNETWAADALAYHHRSAGPSVAVVGEPPGGRTGDDVFHAMLGHLPACLGCRYRSSRSACTCEVPQLWSQVEEVELPRWNGMHDNLRIYVRASEPSTRRRRRRRRLP